MIERAIKARHHKPIFIVDLAVPRDVEAEVARLDDVYVYTVDDLGKVVASGKAGRQAAIAESQSIIDLRVKEFSDWLQLRRAVPTIETMIERAQNLTQSNVDRAKKRLASGVGADEVIDRLVHDITRKLIHDNLTLLKNTEALTSEERTHLEACFKRFYLERKR